MTLTPPVTSIPSPVVWQQTIPPGLGFPADGSGLTFDAGYPLTFPVDPASIPDLSAAFPTLIPESERIVYEAVRNACSTRLIFPTDGAGAPLPASFDVPPDIGLFPGQDSTYPPHGAVAVKPIPVIRGWPTYPGTVPAIGVAESSGSDDGAERVAQAGFAGDAILTDTFGNALATCAYYAEPMHVTVVVELIHVNRDERDRLHEQLRRTLLPLRHLLPSSTSQIKEVELSWEKQDLPLDEQPVVMYLSLFTVEVFAEALIPTEIIAGGHAGVLTSLTTTVTPTEITYASDPPQFPQEFDLT